MTYSPKSICVFIFNVKDMKSGRYENNGPRSKVMFNVPRGNQIVVDVARVMLHQLGFHEVEDFCREIGKEGRFVTHPDFDWITFRQERNVMCHSFLDGEGRTFRFILLFFIFGRRGRLIFREGLDLGNNIRACSFGPRRRKLCVVCLGSIVKDL